MIRLIVFLAAVLFLACQPQLMMPTATSAPEPTEAPTPNHTTTPAPEPTEAPTPTETPTPTPRAVQLPTQPIPPVTPFVRLIGQTGQWKTVRFDYPVLSSIGHGLAAGTPQIRVTCIFYRQGSPVPRVNIGFAEELRHRLIQTEEGEWQGVVNSYTSISGRVVSAEWRTWVTRADRLRLRGEDAYALIREIRDSSAPSFRLDLPDDPHLSRDYDVTELGEAISEGGLTCFE